MTDAPSISESHNLSQALLQGSALLAPKGHQPHGAIATPYVLALHQKQTAFHILDKGSTIMPMELWHIVRGMGPWG
jgi:hypothetical protein